MRPGFAITIALAAAAGCTDQDLPTVTGFDGTRVTLLQQPFNLYTDFELRRVAERYCRTTGYAYAARSAARIVPETNDTEYLFECTNALAPVATAPFARTAPAPPATNLTPYSPAPIRQSSRGIDK